MEISFWQEVVNDAIRWFRLQRIEYSRLEGYNSEYNDGITISLKTFMDSKFEFELSKEEIMYRAECYRDLIKKGVIKKEINQNNYDN